MNKNEYGSIERWLTECFKNSPLQAQTAEFLGCENDFDEVMRALNREMTKRKAKKVSRGFGGK